METMLTVKEYEESNSNYSTIQDKAYSRHEARQLTDGNEELVEILS